MHLSPKVNRKQMPQQEFCIVRVSSITGYAPVCKSKQDTDAPGKCCVAYVGSIAGYAPVS